MDTGDGCGCEGGVGFVYASGEVDGAGGVFDDDGFEAEVVAVDGGVADAEVVGEAAEEEALQATFAEVAGETGGSEMVVFEEGGVAVDVAAEAFAEDEFGVRDVERGVEGGAFGVLEDVFGPEGLRAVVDLDGFEGCFAVCGSEGDVLGWMPVLGEDDVVEFSGEGVDEWDNGVAVCYGQGAAGHEVVLDVDDEEGVGGLELHGGLMVVQWRGVFLDCTTPRYRR